MCFSNKAAKRQIGRERLMTLQQLAYLHEIVRHDFNVSKAAEALKMTQPGLSRQVLELERELGVDIFVRRRNRLVQLSVVGNVIHDLAGSILLQAEGIRRAGREVRESGRGTLTIATTHTQARYVLPNVVQAFARRFPNVSLRLRQGTPSDTARMVADGTADLSIATAPEDGPPGIAFLPCYDLPRIVLTPARHPLARQRKVTLEQLARYPLITYDYVFASTSKVLATFAQHGLSPAVVLNAIDADVIKAYVELGMGIAILPSLAFDAKRDKKLRALPAGHLFEPNVIVVGIRSRDYLSGYAYDFIKMFAPHLDRSTITQMIATIVRG
jgi:LysR family cys regulon transcriptional activator